MARTCALGMRGTGLKFYEEVMDHLYDIIAIVGGGLAGAAPASTASRIGFMALF